MHAHRVKILDGADDNHVADVVTHHLKLVFLPTHDALFDEHLVHWRSLESYGKVVLKIFCFFYKSTTCSSQCVGSTDDEWETNFLGDFFALKHGGCGIAFADPYTNLLHQCFEFLAVFCSINGFNIYADHAYPVIFPNSCFVAVYGQIQGSLPSHGRKHCINVWMIG